MPLFTHNPGNKVMFASPLLLGVVFFTLFLPQTALASGAIQGVICDVVGIVTGDIGRPVATAAIIALAIMALFGRVGWGACMVTVTGIAIIFSASNVVAAIGAGGGCPVTAGVGGAFATVLCGAINLLTGETAQVLATAGVLTVAVAALIGRVGWSMAALIAAGIAGLFAAPDLAALIAGGGGGFCPDTGGAGGGVFSQFFCRAVGLLSSDAARALAMLAVGSVALAAMLGRVGWDKAVLIAVGIIGIFSAPAITALVTGTGATCLPAGTSVFGEILCRAVGLLTSDAAAALATIGVLTVGVAGLLGRVTWGTAALVVAGIAALFGTPLVVTIISGTAVDCPAVNTGVFSVGLCRAAQLLTDGTAQALASLSVIAVAATTLFGRTSWSFTILTAVAIGGLISAPYVANYIVTGNWAATDEFCAIVAPPPPPSAPGPIFIP